MYFGSLLRPPPSLNFVLEMYQFTKNKTYTFNSTLKAKDIVPYNLKKNFSSIFLSVAAYVP